MADPPREAREVYRWGGADSSSKDKRKTEILDEDGNPINPHIPNFISRAPWYSRDQSEPQAGLKHQRLEDNESVERDLEAAPKKRIVLEATSEFKPGACKNCGALGHSHRDCLERPRALGAHLTGRDLQTGVLVQEAAERDFDAKRDRWAGFDPREYDEVIKRYAKLEEVEKKAIGDDGEGDDDDDAELQEGMLGQKVDLDARTRMTVRNLRMREDTAKYLRDLNADPSQYHPKTRSLLTEQQSWQRKSTSPNEKFVWEAKPKEQVKPGEVVEVIPTTETKTKKSKRLAELESLYLE